MTVNLGISLLNKFCITLSFLLFILLRLLINVVIVIY